MNVTVENVEHSANARADKDSLLGTIYLQPVRMRTAAAVFFCKTLILNQNPRAGYTEYTRWYTFRGAFSLAIPLCDVTHFTEDTQEILIRRAQDISNLQWKVHGCTIPAR